MEELGKTSHVTGDRTIGSGAEDFVGSYVVYGVHLLILLATVGWHAFGHQPGVGTLSGTNHPYLLP